MFIGVGVDDDAVLWDFADWQEGSVGLEEWVVRGDESAVQGYDVADLFAAGDDGSGLQLAETIEGHDDVTDAYGFDGTV